MQQQEIGSRCHRVAHARESAAVTMNLHSSASNSLQEVFLEMLHLYRGLTARLDKKLTKGMSATENHTEIIAAANIDHTASGLLRYRFRSLSTRPRFQGLSLSHQV
jgi:hypothetical protein